MRRHRRAIPDNGDYRRDGNERAGEALAKRSEVRHRLSIVERRHSYDEHVAASKRQAEQGHRTVQLGYGTEMWCSARAWSRRSLLRQKHSIESQGRSKALGTNAGANRSRPTRGQGEASRGVVGQSKGKAECSLGEARRDTALAEQVVARPSLASNESIQH